MSDLSEEIGEMFEKIIAQDREEIDRELWVKGVIPGLDEHHRVVKPSIGGLVRQAKRHYAGAPAWDNGRKALYDTAGFFNRTAMAVAIQCVADGLYVGEHPVLWETQDEEWNTVFSSPEFSKETRAIGESIAKDDEAQKVIAKHFAQATNAITKTAGFDNAEGHRVKHIWDIWFTAMGTVAISAYTVGVKLGRERHEKALFAQLQESE